MNHINPDMVYIGKPIKTVTCQCKYCGEDVERKNVSKNVCCFNCKRTRVAKQFKDHYVNLPYHREMLKKPNAATS